MSKLSFAQSNKSLDLKQGTELLRVPHLDSSIPLKFGCCKGQCGTCAIRVVSGEENLSPKTKEELETLARLKLTHHRLACQCALLGDVILDA